MPEGTTSDQVVSAAKELGKPEFTRAELAEKLGVDVDEMKPAFKEARKSGRIERVDDNEEGPRQFRVTD